MAQGSRKKSAGVLAAADMLSGLDKDSQKRVLELMVQKDPEMAKLIEGEMVQIDDLVKLNAKELQEFIKKVSLKDLSLALKSASKETTEHFINNVSKSMALEIKEGVYDTKVPKAEALEAYQRIMEVIRDLVDKGILILNKDNDEYV